MDPNSRLVALGAAGAAAEVLGVEDVFSTWLYTGNGSTQTITNGIDLAGEGGLVWIKDRDSVVGGLNHQLYDTSRGATKVLISNNTDAESTLTNGLTGFTSSGFSLGFTGTSNNNGTSFASWTFRKAPKFFDIVTYTGDGTSNRQIAHGLGSTPGCIIVKATNIAYNWRVYHQSLGITKNLILNDTSAELTQANFWDASPDANEFTVGNSSQVNGSGNTYVAYLFAHDAGGFGADGTESVIKCGSFTTDGSGNATVNLGWEPQWLLYRNPNAAANWNIEDTMRGAAVTDFGAPKLLANSSTAEGSASRGMRPSPTGFNIVGGAGLANTTLIYIAIRRGPMKTPTDATTVFSANLGTSSSVVPTFVTNFPVDLAIFKTGRAAVTPNYTPTRLTNSYLNTTSTAIEAVNGGTFSLQSNTGWGTSYSSSALSWNFRRAPGFFDVVAYAGTGSSSSLINHNLQVIPELVIIKNRSSSSSWPVAVKINSTQYLWGFYLNNSSDLFYGMFPFAFGNTDTQFAIGISSGTDIETYRSGENYIAYLFASLPGVSKVGSYTGTGTTLQVDCGFASGARFVLIRRVDASGDWYVWDTARGIVNGDDSYLLLNSTAAEVTGTDYIDPYSAGFEISSTAPAAINASGGSFIFLAIA